MTKERLKEYRGIEAGLRSIERQMEELDAAVYSIKAVAAAGAPKSRKKNAVTGDFSELLVALLDLKAEYAEQWDDLISRRNEIETAIAALPHMERAIIRAKYIDGLTWEEVAAEVGYSERQVRRIHTEIFKRCPCMSV